MADTPKTPKEIDVFNRFTKFNKLKITLITLGIALVSFIVLYCFIKSLMPYTITIIPDGGLVYGKEIEPVTYRLWERTIEPVGFKKEGFYIEGYYKNKNMTDRYEFGSPIWRSHTLYVNWQPGFAVQLRFAEGEMEYSNMSLEYLKTYHEQYVKPGSQYTVHKVINDIPYLKQEGVLNHEGEELLWFEDADCSGDPIEAKTYTVDKNIVVYGRWFDTNKDKFQVSEDGTLQRYLGTCNKIILPNTIKKIKDIEPSQFISGTSNDLHNADGARLSAFQNVLQDLEIIYINEECTEVGSCAFKGCNALTKVYFRGNNVTRIGKNAFEDCYNLNIITIPDSVATIDARAFRNTTSLKKIGGMRGVTTIGNEAFVSALRLEEIELEKISFIGKSAFAGCYGLKKFVIKNISGVVQSNADTFTGLNNNNILFECDKLATIYVPDTLIDDYKTTTPWSYYADKIYLLSELYE